MANALLVSRSPQSPSDIVTEARAATREDVEAAIVTARAAGRSWARQPATERATTLRQAAAALEQHAREVEDLVVREVGKPRLEARGEVARGVAILHYYAQQVLDPIGDTYPPNLGGLLYTERRPKGVAGLVTPWNFPIAIPLWKAAPALAAGNAIVLKPSSEAIACAELLVGILGAALPAGLVSVVTGGRETAQAVIAGVDVVSFTGSTAVGQQVALAATARGIPVQAEMGGQNAAIVLDDADLESTAAMLVNAAMGYAGQKCTATRRIITIGDPAPLVESLRSALAAAEPGDPADEAVSVGPVITKGARDEIDAAIADAASTGGRLIRTNDLADSDGWFVRPTFVVGLDPGHHLLQEETFGPIAAILRAASLAEAVRLANSVRYGLVSSVHGREMDSILQVVRELDTGMVKVNAPTTGVDFYLPFGGEKDSSVGPREQGKAAMDFYSSTRTVTIASSRPY